jgi:hypothetical protein
LSESNLFQSGVLDTPEAEAAAADVTDSVSMSGHAFALAISKSVQNQRLKSIDLAKMLIILDFASVVSSR